MNVIMLYMGCLLLAILILLFYVCFEEMNSNNLLLALICIAIANGGYLELALARNIEAALLANKIAYIGGCFLPIAGFLAICELCNIRIQRKFEVLMYSVQLLIYMIICSTDYTQLYYLTTEYHQYNGVAYLTKEYGILHFLYSASLYFYLSAGMIILIVAFIKKSLISYRTLILIFLDYVLIMLICLLERQIKCQFEIMPLIYVLSFSYILFVIRRSIIYSVSNNAKKLFENNKSYGFLEFNKNMHYMGSNARAMEIIPELKNMYVDQPITYGDNLIYHRIIPALQEYKSTGNLSHNILKANAKTYEIKIHPITRHRNIVKGYFVELNDTTEHQKYLDMVEGYNRNLESEVDGKTHKIREMQDKMIMGMAQMVESRDLSTGGHIKRTSTVVKVFSRYLLQEDMGFTQKFLYYVQKSAPMHDLGKIAVDDAILRKQGKFTPEEYAIMKTHASAGAMIVKEILTGVESEEFVRIATNVAHYHHEKVDGSGYPQGLKGDEIPVEAKIMALADVFDALVSERCYKEAFSFDEAFDIIYNSLGSHFDQKLGEVFMKCRRELEILYAEFLKEKE